MKTFLTHLRKWAFEILSTLIAIGLAYSFWVLIQDYRQTRAMAKNGQAVYEYVTKLLDAQKKEQEAAAKGGPQQ
jgi:uncharacterized membrane protein YccC